MITLKYFEPGDSNEPILEERGKNAPKTGDELPIGGKTYRVLGTSTKGGDLVKVYVTSKPKKGKTAVAERAAPPAYEEVEPLTGLDEHGDVEPADDDEEEEDDDGEDYGPDPGGEMIE